MDWIIFGLVVVWLGIISWFDIRKSEIPHSAWVVIPLIGAGVYRVRQGGCALVLLTILVVAVSERERISTLFHMEEISRIITWFPLLFLAFFFAVQFSTVAAMAIIGFWVAWELKWWGGADSITAITIGLVWPGWVFILAFLISHILVVVGIGLYSLIREGKIKLHLMPGLPILFASVLLLRIGLFLSS